MWFLALFFLFVTLLTGLAAWSVYRLLRPRVRHAGPLVLVIWLAGLFLLFPIPIHGGFTLTGELYWDALEEWLEQRAERRQAEAKLRRETQLRDAVRFGDAGRFRILDGQSPWFRVSNEFGMTAHLHRASGLVFTDPFPWQPDGVVTWEEADAACREIAPAATWALPTQAELYLFWRDDGRAVSPWGQGQFVSVAHDMDLGLSMTVRHAGPGPHLLRCVTRDPAAGGAAVSRDDIPLEEWNRFQLDPERYR